MTKGSNKHPLTINFSQKAENSSISLPLMDWTAIRLGSVLERLSLSYQVFLYRLHGGYRLMLLC